LISDNLKISIDYAKINSGLNFFRKTAISLYKPPVKW
jgi:hypothetical protein